MNVWTYIHIPIHEYAPGAAKIVKPSNESENAYYINLVTYDPGWFIFQDSSCRNTDIFYQIMVAFDPRYFLSN